MSYVTTLAGVQMPKLIYGTAWKKERTTDLVVKAVLHGYRGIDTACQPKHYREDLVGKALVELAKQNIPRDSLFIQTKFTSVDGQDPKNIPYDPNADLPSQVRQSFQVSQKNLKTEYIDSLVLHSPMKTHPQTMQVWRVFEEFYSLGKTKQLGISNVSLSELKQLYQDSEVKPSVVQNRFYHQTHFDKELRAFCREKGIIYQSFWTLSANPNITQNDAVVSLARSISRTPEQLFFRYLMQKGIVPLTGCCSELHMRQDMDCLHFELNQRHIEIFDHFIPN